MFTLKDEAGRLFVGFYAGVADWCHLAVCAKKFATRGQAQKSRVALFDRGFKTTLLENGVAVTW